MELKVVCNCGQKFKFDVEPVNGQMPFTVNCPVCGLDGTGTANTLLAQSGVVSPTLPVATPRIHRVPAQAPASAGTPPPIPTRRPVAIAPAVKAAGQFNLGLGVVGALLGAVVGAGVMIAIFEWGGFRFPLLGVGIGCLTGLGAKLLGKGGDQTLGILSAVMALTAVVGALYFMYGEFPMLNIISVIVSASVAYRMASK
jgi:hypothetical protein